MATVLAAFACRLPRTASPHLDLRRHRRARAQKRPPPCVEGGRVQDPGCQPILLATLLQTPVIALPAPVARAPARTSATSTMINAYSTAVWPSSLRST